MNPALVIATRNEGKLQEFVELLGDSGVDVLSLRDFPDAPIVPEEWPSYIENATAKARAIAQHTGLPALGDDSGLEVDALGGGPGVRSARFAGDPADDCRNVEKLLHVLDRVPDEARTARFRCALVVARPDGATIAVEGVCEGRIVCAPAGDAGFGYDPVFFEPVLGRTFAQLTGAEKHQVSHRGRACAALRAQLVSFLRASDAS